MLAGFRRVPWWLRFWLLWLAIAVALAVRSLRATDLQQVDPAGRRPEVSVALSGNGTVLCWQVPRTDGGTDLCVYRPGQGPPQRLERGNDGLPLDESSQQPALDGSGRFLAFSSHASNWTADDRNGLCDVFWRDLQTGETVRVVPPDPKSGLSSAYRPSLSPDGQTVAYTSYGVPNVNNVRGRNVCVWNRKTYESLVYPTSAVRGTGPVLGSPVFDPSGKRLAFSAFAYDLLPEPRDPVQYEIYFLELQRSQRWPPYTPRPQDLLDGWWPVARLSTPTSGRAADAHSYEPVLTRDECIWVSQADNFVPDDQNLCHDLFVCPLWKPGPVRRLSLTSDGQEANGSSMEPVASQDGRFVAFTSYASNLVKDDRNGQSDVFCLDRQHGSVRCLSAGLPGPSYRPAMSYDGSKIAFVSRAADGRRHFYLVEEGRREELPSP